jgi:hypothetical protein
MADRPEAQQADAVLASHHLVVALTRRQTPLARVADVGRDGAQRVLARQTGHDALAVVADHEGRRAPHAPPFDRHAPRIRIEGILDELRHGLARIALTAREPANEIERVSRLELEAGGRRLRGHRTPKVGGRPTGLQSRHAAALRSRRARCQVHPSSKAASPPAPPVSSTPRRCALHARHGTPWPRPLSRWRRP